MTEIKPKIINVTEDDIKNKLSQDGDLREGEIDRDDYRIVLDGDDLGFYQTGCSVLLFMVEFIIRDRGAALARAEKAEKELKELKELLISVDSYVGGDIKAYAGKLGAKWEEKIEGIAETMVDSKFPRPPKCPRCGEALEMEPKHPNSYFCPGSMCGFGWDETKGESSIIINGYG